MGMKASGVWVLEVKEVWNQSEWVRTSQKRRAVCRIVSKDGINWDYT